MINEFIYYAMVQLIIKFEKIIIKLIYAIIFIILIIIQKFSKTIQLSLFLLNNHPPDRSY
jgi:hypothetical protein